MNSTVTLILAYFPAVVSFLGSVASVFVCIKKVTAKLDESAGLKNELGKLNQKLTKQLEQNEAQQKQIEALRLQLKGIKEREK